MKFSCNRKDMLTAIKRTAKAADPRSKVSALTGILITADADAFEVSLTATDLVTTVRCVAPAPVEEGGSMVVNAQMLTDMFSLFGGEIVRLESRENHLLKLSSEHASYTIACLDPDSFPKLELPEMAGSMEVQNLKSLARQTVFAVSSQASNPAMRCVKLEIRQDSLRAVGCDGSVLSASLRQIASGGSTELLIPADAFSKLAGLISDDEKLRLGFNDKYASFYSEEPVRMLFSTRLGHGSYLDVDGLLDHVDRCYEAVVDAKALCNAIEGLDSVAVPGSHIIRMNFQLGQIGLSYRGEESSGQTALPAQVFVPTPEEGFCLQTKKLLACLRPMTGEIRLSFSKDGLLVISAGDQTFLQTAARERVAAKKTKKTRKPTAKAA